MKMRLHTPSWAKSFQRTAKLFTRLANRSAAQALGQAKRATPARRVAPAAGASWLVGVAMSAAGARRFRLFRPAGVAPGERLPLMVMLHGCGQDANAFAASTRMNNVATRERFLVLYPEQDRLANGQEPVGLWVGPALGLQRGSA